MTVLACDFRSIVGDHAQGRVTIESTLDRPAHSIPGAVIIPVRETYRLVDGQCVIGEIDPGPVAVEVSAEGVFRRWEISVPAEGRFELSELLDATAEYEPLVVSRVVEAASEASKSATAAGKSASAASAAAADVQRVVGDATGVLRNELADDITAIEQTGALVQPAAEAAASAREVAEQARDTSTTARDEAVAARDVAVEAESTATSARDEAVASAQNLQESVEQSETARAAADAAAVRAKAYADSRPVSLALRAEGMQGTTQDAAGALRGALKEADVVEIPAGARFTINSGVVVIPEGKELRGGPGSVLQSNDSTAPYIEVNGGTLRNVTIDHKGKGGTTGVRITAGSVQSRCLDVTVRGANRGFLIGETAGGVGGPAVDPLLNSCHVVDAGEYGYLFEATTGAIMVACRGNGAGLDIIKLRTKVRQLSIIGGEFTGAGRSASSAGDGLDGFAGAEGLTITGGAWFHDNAGNGVVVKSDDDSTGASSIEDYRALNGKPQRVLIDGITCSDNAGNGISIHRSDYQDSEVLTQSKPLPHLRDFVVTNFICADNTGAGMLVNARYGQISNGILVRNRFHGMELLKEARDIGLSGIRSIANGYPGSSIDGFVIAGKRIRVHQCFAHGVDIYAVADADLDGTDKDQRPTRFGFRIPTGAEVRLTDCGSYHTRVAALSDFPHSPMIGCDWRNPTTGDQFPAGIHAGAGELIGWREGPYLRKNGAAVEISADGRAGWRAI